MGNISGGSQKRQRHDRIAVYYDMLVPLWKKELPSILALYPNTLGMGYSYFKSGYGHFISRMMSTRNKNKDKFFKRICGLIDGFAPGIVILPKYDCGHGGVRHRKKHDFLHSVSEYCKCLGISVVLVSRKDTRQTFINQQVKTKYEIAKLLASWIPTLKSRMFRERTASKNEQYNSAIFDAVALVISFLTMYDCEP